MKISCPPAILILALWVRCPTFARDASYDLIDQQLLEVEAVLVEEVAETLRDGKNQSVMVTNPQEQLRIKQQVYSFILELHGGRSYIFRAGMQLRLRVHFSERPMVF